MLKIIASESHDPLKTPNKSLCCFQRRLAEWNSLLAGITSTQSGHTIDNDLTLVFWGWKGAIGGGGGGGWWLKERTGYHPHLNFGEFPNSDDKT